jgi:uncharacterized protein (TIGR03546 family)
MMIDDTEDNASSFHYLCDLEVVMVFNWFIKIFVALNANSNPAQVAGAVAGAFLIALLPAGNLFALLILALFFFIRINNVFLCICIPLFMLFTRVFDPILNAIGYGILSLPPCAGYFTWLFNIPIVPFSAFNNTLVAGALAAGIILFVPIFICTRILVSLYRKQVRDRIARSKFAKAFMNIPAIAKIFKTADSIRNVALGG